MKFSIRFADKIVGTLVILALAVIIFVIFMLGRSQRWFVKDYQYKTHFSSASGVSPNMAIQYKGFTIGHVKKISLDENDNVEVIFNIFEEYGDRVREGSVIELQASPIGLGNAFIFHPGKGEQLPEGVLIPEISSPEAKRLIAAGLADRVESSDKINSVLTSVDSLLASLNSSLTTKDEYGNTALDSIISDIKGTLASIDYILGDISGKADPILGNVSTILGNVETIIEPEGELISNIEGALGSLSGILYSVDETIKVIPENLPRIIILLSDLHNALLEAEKLIISLTNNPLLKGGVPEVKDANTGGVDIRKMDF